MTELLSPGAERVNILLVDDRVENLVALEAILEPLGQRLVRATSGSDALRRLLHEDFALILLDVQMPGLDGFQTAELFRQREKTRHIPVMFLTAVSSEPQQVFRGYETGAVDYLSKPLDPVVLRSKVAVFVDLHQLRARAELLAIRALHDPLTELPNRTLFLDRLTHAVSRLERSHEVLAVLFLDLDCFKDVNDGLGHAAGDELLVEFAQRLRRSVRPSDTVARMGGDEFTVLCEGLGDAHDVDQVVVRIREVLAAPFRLEGEDIVVTASLGVATAADAERKPTDLLREADLAMYEAKAEGRGSWEYFHEGMPARAAQRYRAERDLLHAVETGALRVLYQPIVALRSDTVVGVEALVRWQHPERGLLLPAAFVPLAELTGVIVPVGAWVLEEACRQARQWRLDTPGVPPLTVSVNLSVVQLADPGLVSQVLKGLDSTGLDPSQLCLELTETALMSDVESNTATLVALHDAGVRLAIDDFGTGYSSLGHLKRFSVDVLKVDRSFVGGLGHNLHDTAIVRAVQTLAQEFGLSATAEGVETAEQASELVRLGFDTAQGYLFGRPQPAAAITELLKRGEGVTSPAV